MYINNRNNMFQIQISFVIETKCFKFKLKFAIDIVYN